MPRFATRPQISALLKPVSWLVENFQRSQDPKSIQIRLASPSLNRWIHFGYLVIWLYYCVYFEYIYIYGCGYLVILLYFHFEYMDVVFAGPKTSYKCRDS